MNGRYHSHIPLTPYLSLTRTLRLHPRKLKSLTPNDKQHTAELKKDLQSSHFNIGREDYKNDWSTTTSERNYPPGYVTKRTDNSELKKDLRAVHFILGDDKPVFKSTAHRTFTKFSEGVDRSDFKSAKTLLRNFENLTPFRMSDGKDEWTRTPPRIFVRNQSMRRRYKRNVNARIAKKALQKTSVKLGSETKMDYYPFNTCKD